MLSSPLSRTAVVFLCALTPALVAQPEMKGRWLLPTANGSRGYSGSATATLA